MLERQTSPASTSSCIARDFVIDDRFGRGKHGNGCFQILDGFDGPRWQSFQSSPGILEWPWRFRSNGLMCQVMKSTRY
jgi:hypothetical protein